MSLHFHIAVPAPTELPRPIPTADALRLAVESFRTDPVARRTYNIPLASLPAMARRHRYPAGLRAANERRKA